MSGHSYHRNPGNRILSQKENKHGKSFGIYAVLWRNKRWRKTKSCQNITGSSRWKGTRGLNREQVPENKIRKFWHSRGGGGLKEVQSIRLARYTTCRNVWHRSFWCVIRSTIHEFYVHERTSLTVSKLLPKVRNRKIPNLKGGKYGLWKTVNELKCNS